MRIKLIFPGEPKAIQSVRFARRGDFIAKYQPKKNEDWKSYIRVSAQQQLPDDWMLLDCPLKIKKALFVFNPIKSLKKDEKQIIELGGFVSKSTKPDLTDNLFKGVIDALTGIVYRDDALIHTIESSQKVYGAVPRIEIEFEFYSRRIEEPTLKLEF